MDDETSGGFGRKADRSRSPGGDPGEQSPLQARAKFLQNWSWDTVIRLNRGACERGRAQHGLNQETQATVAQRWETQRKEEFSLGELIQFLRSCHRSAPFLFFNGNTFADIGRQITTALFAELPTMRRREVASAVAHCIAGVLDEASMTSILSSLSETASLKPGDHVRTFRGTGRGVIVRILDDGRVVWRSHSSESELIALPESLVREKKSQYD